MILYIARHGETDLNIQDRYQGISDSPLNDRGLQQAAALAAGLPAGIVHVISSPQKRAYQTASALAEARRLPLETMSHFRERDFGIFDGLTPAEVQKRHPDLWERKIVQQWNDAPPGGETTRDVVRRVANGSAFCAEHTGMRQSPWLRTVSWCARCAFCLVTSPRKNSLCCRRSAMASI